MSLLACFLALVFNEIGNSLLRLARYFSNLIIKHQANDDPLSQVQSIFQLLGGYEYSPGTQALGLSNAIQKVSFSMQVSSYSLHLHPHNIWFLLPQDYVNHPVHCSDPKRLESLIRFYEKRKRRCYEKKIRYGVRQEVAFR